MNEINRIKQEKNEHLKNHKRFQNWIKMDHSDQVKTISEKSKTAKFDFKKFLDVHSLKDFDEETLKNLQRSPVDEFGIKHLNILYNKEDDKFFCLLEAPNKEAVEKHHHKHGVKCNWITEVKTTS